MSGKQKAGGWVEVRGTVPEGAEAEYARLQAMLPPGTPVTVDMMRPWLLAHTGRAAPSRSQPKVRRNGGPPPGLVDGVTVGRIIEAIAEVGGAPTQPVVAERMGCTDRRVRQVLRAEGLKWVDVLARAARKD